MTVTISGSGTIAGITSGGLGSSPIITQPELVSGVAGNGPAFSAYASASQTITLSTWTKVAIDTIIFDTNSNFSTTNNRFTPTVAGYYQVNGVARVSAVTTITTVASGLYKNGSALNFGSIVAATMTPNNYQQCPVSSVVYMNGSTDYIELYGFVSGTGTATINSTSASVTSQFSAALVRSA